MLAAEDFYTRSTPEQVTNALREQARVAQALEEAEAEWFRLQEALEGLSA